jgi:hypothetical protein
MYKLILTKMGWAKFFKNSSGHPDPGPVPCGPNYALIFSDINENSKCSHVVVFDDTIF